MGLFKCKHYVSYPDVIKVVHSARMGEWNLQNGLIVTVSGVCDHCKCHVTFSEYRIDNYLYRYFSLLSQSSEDK